MVEYFLGNGKWLLECAGGILLLILLNVIVRFGLKGLLYKREWISTRWQQILDRSFWTPFHLLLTVIGASFTLKIILRESGFTSWFDLVQQIRDLGVLICVTWFVLGAIRESRRTLLRGSTMNREDRGMADLLSKVVSILIWIPAAGMVLDLLGLPWTGILAIGTVAGGALALAAREMMSNFFGGIMVYFTRPFVVGDRIQMMEKKLEGVVDEIGWYTTVIRTSERMPISIPNNQFSNGYVANLTRQGSRLLQETLRVSQEDRSKVSSFIQRLQELLDRNEEMDPRCKRIVYLDHVGHGISEVQIVAYCKWTEDVSFFPIRTRLLTEVDRICQEMEIRLVPPLVGMIAPC